MPSREAAACVKHARQCGWLAGLSSRSSCGGKSYVYGARAYASGIDSSELKRQCEGPSALEVLEKSEIRNGQLHFLALAYQSRKKTLIVPSHVNRGTTPQAIRTGN
jgi:hypothetical protein